MLRQGGHEVPEALTKFGTGVKKKQHSMYGNFGPKDGGGAPMKKAMRIKFD